MVQEGVQWFGDLTENISIICQVGNQAAFVSQTVKSLMYASEYYNVTVTMKNTGSTTWRTNRVVLPGDVPPGGQVTFSFTVLAPTKAGTYNFQWRMVQEGVEWFGASTPNVTVSVKTPCTTC